MNELETHALKLLRRDTLDEAEKLVGPGDNAIALGIVALQQLAQEKEDVFSVLGDTYFSVSYAECEFVILPAAGFKKIYHETHGDSNDSYDIWWHEAGLLLTSESYTSSKRFLNTLQVYYNWVPTSLDTAYNYTSSGGYDAMADGTMVWAGHYDGREGLLTHLKQLREHGYFLANWFKQPFLWLLNYSETRKKDYDYEAINKLKFVVLPAHVQRAIGPIN
jgi:hypothetical protein